MNSEYDEAGFYGPDGLQKRYVKSESKNAKPEAEVVVLQQRVKELEEQVARNDQEFDNQMKSFMTGIYQQINEALGLPVAEIEVIGGKEYKSFKGPLPRLKEMAAERDAAMAALAKCEPLRMDWEPTQFECVVCGGITTTKDHLNGIIIHTKDCLWRRAREEANNDKR